jgi:hypothetical protein
MGRGGRQRAGQFRSHCRLAGALAGADDRDRRLRGQSRPGRRFEREPRAAVGKAERERAGGEEQPGPRVEDGLVGEVDDLVRLEAVDTGQQRRQRRLAEDHVVDPVLRRDRRAGRQLLGTAEQRRADDRATRGAQLLDRRPHDRRVVLPVDQHERARRRMRLWKGNGRGSGPHTRAAWKEQQRCGAW